MITTPGLAGSKRIALTKIVLFSQPYLPVGAVNFGVVYGQGESALARLRLEEKLHAFVGDPRFVPDAVCWPIEPHDFRFMARQLKRWSHGFVQNVQLHWRGLLHVPYLRSAVAVSMWAAGAASASSMPVGSVGVGSVGVGSVGVVVPDSVLVEFCLVVCFEDESPIYRSFQSAT